MTALLNQNPEIHAGTLSPVFELMYYTNEILHKEQAQAFPKPKVFQEIVTNTLINYYSDIDKPVVIDAASTLSGVSTSSSVGVVTTTNDAGLAVTTTTTTDTTSYTFTDVTTVSSTSTSETTTDGVTTRTDTVTTTERTNYETSYDYAAEATRLWNIYTTLNS